MAWKVGVLVDGLRMPLRDGIAKAAELGADGIQFFCTGKGTRPEDLNPAARRDLRAHIRKCGLKLFALCSDQGKGFFSAEARAFNVEFTKAAIKLASDLGTSVVTSHIGHVPDNQADADAGKKALREIGEHAKYLSVFFASETGPENPPDLAKLMEEIGSDGVGVNYDPANLVGKGFDQIGGVKHLARWIKHTHAKDRKRGGSEVPLGEGDVDFPKWTAALREFKYEGPLTIEREGGEDRAGDMKRAIEFLRKLTT